MACLALYVESGAVFDVFYFAVMILGVALGLGEVVKEHSASTVIYDVARHEKKQNGMHTGTIGPL